MTTDHSNAPEIVNVPPKMTRIEALMKDLEDYSDIKPYHRLIADPVLKTMSEARQLILDLLGIGEKSPGEEIYTAYRRKIHAEYGDEGAGDLRAMILMAKRWLPECYPVTPDGKVDFMRAIVEALISSAEVHLQRRDIRLKLLDAIDDKVLKTLVDRWDEVAIILRSMEE